MIHLALNYIAFELNRFLSRVSIFDKVEKLILDMGNRDRRELNPAWGMCGEKYMPSVLSRVRMIAIDSDGVTGRRHIVAEPTVHADAAKGL